MTSSRDDPPVPGAGTNATPGYELLRQAALKTSGAILTAERRAAAELELVQQKLTEVNAWQRAILDSANVAIIATEPNGLIRSFNRTAESMLGYQAAEVIGKITPEIIHDETEVRKRAAELELELGRAVPAGFEVFFAKVRTGVPEEREWTYVRKDGSRFPVRLSVTAMLDASGAVTGFWGIATDLTESKRNEALLSGQRLALEMIACGAALGDTLDTLLRVIEAQAPEMLCSLLLLDADGKHLRHGAAPSLPAAYSQAIDGLAIGPRVGACGTAAYRREAVLSEDISTDPLWEGVRELPLRHGLRACWSTPIFDAKKAVLGTFAIYFRQPGRPTGHHLQLIDMATQTAAVAINHDRTQWELSVSEGRYRRLVTSNVIGVIVANTNGSMLEANDLFLEWIGYTREDLRSGSLRWDVLTPPEWRETDERIIAELMATGSCAQVEKEYFRKDGSRLPILVSLALLEGTPGDAICLIENLTKRKQADAALLESEARYRDLVEHSDDLFCTHDLEGRLLSINEACVRSTGFSRKQLLEMNIVDILLPEKRAGGLEYLKQIREHGQVQGIMKILTAKKEVRLWEFNNTVRREGLAEPIVRGIAHDITARKHWERTLRDSEERFRSIFEQAPLGIAEGVVTTASFVRVNQRYADIVGYSKEELIRMTFKDFTHPDDLDLDLVEFGRLTAGEIREYSIEKRYLRKDGSTVWVTLSVTALTATGSKPEHCMAMIEDVTERKNLEAQFLQAQKMEAVGQLSGGIAHDFNNIITVIKGRVGLLQQDSGFDRDQAECLDEIAVAAARAAALTQQLLAFSRRQVMQQRDIDLPETVRNIATMLRRMVREDIKVRLEFSPEELWIHADSGMIEQLMMNLAVNARDAMPQGGELAIATSAVVVSEEQAARWPMAEAGRFVRLTVADTGCGIAPEVLAHIFEPFFTTKKVGEGTGLGLATVYGIVQQHRGGVEVESRIGVGTTFEIYLPRCAVPTESTPPVRETPAIPGGTETILLVEDDAAVQMVACAVLERLGYKLHVADTGREALGIWKEHHAQIQLLLTDLVMPDGINGHELARQLKLKRPELRVILTSGYSASVAGKDFPLDDTIDFLAKPYEIHALAAMVRQSLDKALP